MWVPAELGSRSFPHGDGRASRARPAGPPWNSLFIAASKSHAGRRRVPLVAKTGWKTQQAAASSRGRSRGCGKPAGARFALRFPHGWAPPLMAAWKGSLGCAGPGGRELPSSPHWWGKKNGVAFFFFFLPPENVRRRQSSKNVAESPRPAVTEQHEVRGCVHRPAGLADLCPGATGGEARRGRGEARRGSLLFLQVLSSRFHCTLLAFRRDQRGARIEKDSECAFPRFLRCSYIFILSAGKNPRCRFFSRNFCRV